MPKKIPTNFNVDAPKSAIRRAQKSEKMSEKGSGGIKHETKEYKKELKVKKHAKKTKR